MRQEGWPSGIGKVYAGACRRGFRGRGKEKQTDSSARTFPRMQESHEIQEMRDENCPVEATAANPHEEGDAVARSDLLKINTYLWERSILVEGRTKDYICP